MEFWKNLILFSDRAFFIFGLCFSFSNVLCVFGLVLIAEHSDGLYGYAALKFASFAKSKKAVFVVKPEFFAKLRIRTDFFNVYFKT